MTPAPIKPQWVDTNHRLTEELSHFAHDIKTPLPEHIAQWPGFAMHLLEHPLIGIIVTNLESPSKIHFCLKLTLNEIFLVMIKPDQKIHCRFDFTSSTIFYEDQIATQSQIEWFEKMILSILEHLEKPGIQVLEEISDGN